MRPRGLICLALCLGALATPAGAADAAAAWDSRCEQCHGAADEFAGKYLWTIGGQLQGRHHVTDLRRFIGNHYTPDHLVDTIQALLARHANTAARFAPECGGCHGSVESFARESIEFRWRKVRGVKSGMALDEYLPTHQDLQTGDAEFFARLLARFVDPIEPEEPAVPQN